MCFYSRKKQNFTAELFWLIFILNYLSKQLFSIKLYVSDIYYTVFHKSTCFRVYIGNFVYYEPRNSENHNKYNYGRAGDGGSISCFSLE